MTGLREHSFVESRRWGDGTLSPSGEQGPAPEGTGPGEFVCAVSYVRDYRTFASQGGFKHLADS